MATATFKFDVSGQASAQLEGISASDPILSYKDAYALIVLESLLGLFLLLDLTSCTRAILLRVRSLRLWPGSTLLLRLISSSLMLGTEAVWLTRLIYLGLAVPDPPLDRDIRDHPGDFVQSIALSQWTENMAFASSLHSAVGGFAGVLYLTQLLIALRFHMRMRVPPSPETRTSSCLISPRLSSSPLVASRRSRRLASPLVASPRLPSPHLALPRLSSPLLPSPRLFSAHQRSKHLISQRTSARFEPRDIRR